MSNLLVQNIKHTNNTTSMAIDTSGQVTIRGESSATTTNLQQGLCKAWVNFDGVTTTAIDDSFNFGSITDVSTGRTTHTFTNNMGNANWASSWFTNSNAGTGLGYFTNDLVGNVCTRSTSSFQTESYTASALVDSKENDAKIHGDLA